MDHQNLIGRFVRDTDGAWRVAVEGRITGEQVAVGDRVQVRRRGKAAQWVTVGSYTGCLVTGEFLYEVRKRHAAPAAPQAAPVSAPLGAAVEEEPEEGPAAPSTPTAPSAPIGSVDAAIAALIAATAPRSAALDEDAVLRLVANEVRRIVADEVAKGGRIKEHLVYVFQPSGTVTPIDGAHEALADLITMLGAGTDVQMVGPAGCGKSTMAKQASEALGRKFYAASALRDEHQLLGFIDAGGAYRRTAFRDAFEYGGAFLFDELDGSYPAAVLPFNGALANRYCAFPDGMVYAHADFIALAACNTYGHGADRTYVGRLQQDATTLDRFVTLEVGYDEALETRMAVALNSANGATWASEVQAFRAKVGTAGLRHIVSPRASIHGARLLAAGLAIEKVRESTLYKGLTRDQRATLGMK